MQTHRQSFRQKALAAVTVLALVPAMAEAQTKVKSGFNTFTPQQDVEIGRQSAAEAERQLPILNDSNVQAYIDNMGQRLAANAPGPKFPYRFRVVNASDINAFALPGGFLYINRGTIEAARNDGEVAGVLAHEIAHAALRHGTQQASKAYLTQAGLGILGGLLGGKVGAGTAQVINAVGGFGLNALFLKYSREAENQADVIGAQMLAKSGYSPADMASFFRTLQSQSARQSGPTWLSSHPDTNSRIKNVQREATMLSASGQAGVRTSQFNSVQSRLNGMSKAPSMAQIAQGARQPTNTSTRGRSTGRQSTQGIEAPSRTLRTYTNRNRVFQVQYPSNWEVVSENENGVTLSTRGGYGQINGQNEVVYGAIISHFEPREEGGMGGYDRPTLREATSELVGAIQQSSPHLKVVRNSAQNFRATGGSDAMGVTLRGTSPNTRLQERVTVVTRQLNDGHLVYMLFITPERDASAFSPALQAMVGSLQVGNH